MTVKTFIAALVEKHGAIVRTQYHIQIPCGDKFHDVWNGREGLKMRLHGTLETHEGSPEALLHRLESHHPEANDLALMQSLTRLVVKHVAKSGIFVDAGWKAGLAKACFLRLHADGDKEILIREFAAASSHEAELAVIRIAAERCPGEVIHSDCKSAVDAFGPPAVWIPRESNKVADKLGNKRGSN